jgi:PAS domain S-box-containing protein
MKHDAKTRPAESGTPHRTRVATKGPQKIAVKSESSGTDIRLELSDILDAFPFYVMLVDDHHHILQANSAVRAQLGVDPKDIVGKYCPTAVHGLDKPIDGCPLEEAAERNQAVEREIFDQASKRWVRSAIYPTRGSTVDGRRIFFHMVADITDRKQAEENLRVSQKQLRELALHLESVREDERTNLAREIHDELGQLLTGLKMDTSWMSKRIPQSETSLIGKAEAMGGLIDEAIETVKRVSAQLRPAVLDYLGLAAAIEWQTKELEKHSEISFEFKSHPRDIVLDRDRSTAIFRICQEALTNVVRHASATKVKVTLKEEPGSVILKVRDNGKGIEKEQLSDPKAFGIIGMRERAYSWGGEVEINGIPGKGTAVVVSIPLVNGEELDVKNSDRR